MKILRSRLSCSRWVLNNTEMMKFRVDGDDFQDSHLKVTHSFLFLDMKNSICMLCKFCTSSVALLETDPNVFTLWHCTAALVGGSEWGVADLAIENRFLITDQLTTSQVKPSIMICGTLK